MVDAKSIIQTIFNKIVVKHAGSCITWELLYSSIDKVVARTAQVKHDTLEAEAKLNALKLQHQQQQLQQQVSYICIEIKMSLYSNILTVGINLSC